MSMDVVQIYETPAHVLVVETAVPQIIEVITPGPKGDMPDVSFKLDKAAPSYTGGLTGDAGVVNIGEGQFYKDADVEVY